jgi:hypothetical protein
MIDVTFKFPDRDSAMNFLAYMCDGGGEYPYLEHMDTQELGAKIGRFDYQKCFAPDSTDLTIIAVPEDE